MVPDSVPTASQSRNSLSVPPRLGPELRLDLISDGFEAAARTVDKRFGGDETRGRRTSEEAGSCEAAASPFYVQAACACLPAPVTGFRIVYLSHF